MVESLNNLGVIHCQSRNYKKGLRYYKDSLKILQHARDETHRFGVMYNRQLRKLN